jgi:hypothetical protein
MSIKFEENRPEKQLTAKEISPRLIKKSSNLLGKGSPLQAKISVIILCSQIQRKRIGHSKGNPICQSDR